MADAPGGTVPAATVAEAVLDYINTMTGIPTTCRFGELADKTPALSMQGQSRAKKRPRVFVGRVCSGLSVQGDLQIA